MWMLYNWFSDVMCLYKISVWVFREKVVIVVFFVFKVFILLSL